MALQMSSRPFNESSNLAEFVPGTTPKPKPNGGLYTGDLATGDWGNTPISPDSGDMLNMGTFVGSMHTISHVRSGNNSVSPVASMHRIPWLNASFPKV